MGIKCGPHPGATEEDIEKWLDELEDAKKDEFLNRQLNRMFATALLGGICLGFVLGVVITITCLKL